MLIVNKDGIIEDDKVDKYRDKFERQQTLIFNFITAYLCGDETSPDYDKFQQLNKLKGRKAILDFCKKELLVSRFSGFKK